MLYSNPKNDNKSVSSKTMEINNYNCMKLIMIMIMITLDYDFLGYDFFVSTFCLPFVFFFTLLLRCSPRTWDRGTDRNGRR